MLLLSVVFNTCPFFVHIYQLLIEMTKSPKVSYLSQRTLLVDQCYGYIQTDSDVCITLGFVYTWAPIYHVTFPTNMVSCSAGCISSCTCSAVDSLHVVKWYMKCFMYWTADLKSSKLWSSQLWAQFKQLRIETSWLERRTGIARSRVQTPLKTWLFQASILRNCLNCVLNCDDHGSLEPSRYLHNPIHTLISLEPGSAYGTGWSLLSLLSIHPVCSINTRGTRLSLGTNHLCCFSPSSLVSFRPLFTW